MKVKVKIFSAILFVLILMLSLSSVAQAAELEQRSEFAAPIMIVNTSFLNVRTGPGAQYSVLLTVVGGTEFPVLGVYTDKVWYQVSTVVGVGWINSQFVLPRGDFSNVPSVSLEQALETALDVLDARAAASQSADPSMDDAVGTSSFVAGRDWGVIVTTDHPLRTAPSVNASGAGHILASNSIIYPVLQATNSEGTSWYRIGVPGITNGAWIGADLTRFRPYGCGRYTVVSFNKDLAPAKGADGSGTLDGNTYYVKAGDEAYLLDHVNGFYKVELLDGNTGWLEAGSATIRDESKVDKLGYCERRAAQTSTSGGVVDTSDGQGGGGEATVDRLPLLSTARVVINTAFLNARSGPGAQYTVVATLAGGAEAQVLGYAPDGVWYLVSGTWGQGWINSEFTLFRGDGSNIPVIRDFSGSLVSIPTASITNAVVLYAAPNVTLGSIGALSGPLEVNIVARTSDSTWVQVSTTLGFGWIRASEVVLQGDLSRIPVVGS